MQTAVMLKSILKLLFPQRRPPAQPAASADASSHQQEMMKVAQRMVDVINESIQLAANSHDIGTKMSRLDVADVTLKELKAFCAQHPYLTITSLPEVERTLADLCEDFVFKAYGMIADDNERAHALEKEGKVDEAIAIYEGLSSLGVDTPFTYRRLAIIYRKQRDRDKEISALRAGLTNVRPENAAHYAWLRDRLAKLVQP